MMKRSKFLEGSFFWKNFSLLTLISFNFFGRYFLAMANANLTFAVELPLVMMMVIIYSRGTNSGKLLLHRAFTFEFLLRYIHG